MDLSIIIPVYNCEKYLGRCLDSILESIDRFSGHIEVLLVDNGSKDGSNEISKKYKKRYPNVINLFIQTAPGAAAARNYGASKAKGKYIWFIDADDTIASDSILKLFKKAEEESADLVMMGASRIFMNGSSNYLSAVHSNQKDYKSRFVRYGIGPWQIIIKKDWWSRYKFKFREGIIHEDMEMMSALILYTDKFSYIDEPLYNYYQNPNSVLHKDNYDPHCFDIFPALEGLYRRFNKAKMTKKYYNELEWFFIWNLLIDSAKDFGRFKEGHDGFKYSREMLKKYFPNWRKNNFLNQKSLKLKALVFFNYYRCR